MNNIPIAVKILINIFLFIVYSLLGIIFGNFLYGFILFSIGKNVPGNYDPIHLKIAGIILFFISIVTIIFRKYFYLLIKTTIKEKKGSKNNDNDNETNSQGMKIYIDKEVK